MVGSTLLSELRSRGYNNVSTIKSQDLDLKNQHLTNQYILDIKPEYIFLVAAKVGGIQANIHNPGEFLYDNLMIQSNVINSAKDAKVKRLLFLGSSCIYPRMAKQPMVEDYILGGPLEPTNESYAIAKIAGIKLCQYFKKQYNCNFFSVIPPNIYGPHDNFSLKNSHVVSALIKKIYNAKVVGASTLTLWGTGKARRELMYSEDLVDGLIFLMEKDIKEDYINLGTNEDVSISSLANLIKKVIGYGGNFEWDLNKPDGMPKKLMDSSKINDLNWRANTSLDSGINKTFNWYKNSIT